MNAAGYIRAHNKIRPGMKTYACGFAIARTGRKVTKLLMPCQVELCCCSVESVEPKLRAAGKPAAAVTPVLPDGTLDWANSRDLWSVCLADTEDEIRADMAAQIDTATHILQNLQNQLTKTTDRVLAIKSDFKTLPSLPSLT